MPGPFDGVRVVEVAAWTFVPAASAIIADLGGDVIKVEPPTGDPQRGLQNMLNLGTAGANPFLEIPNRGKRSITLDLSSDEGRGILLELVESADVFLTSYLPQVREKLRIDADDLWAANPRLIYVRGSGWGTKGAMANVGGYDLASAWASSGLAHRLTPEDGEPAMQPPAFFDLQGANTIAGAIAMALLRRERTGETGVVDVSLLNVGMWTMAPDIVGAPYVSDFPRPDRHDPGNPIVNWYQTKDRRWLYLVCLQGDRFWPELCNLMGRPDLVDDPRFVDAAARYENRGECVAALDDVFATRTLEEWKEVLSGFSGVWAPVLSFKDIHEHPQVQANGYLPAVTSNDGVDFRLVSPAMHFDDVPSAPVSAAPELGQHTEEILLELGMDWDKIAEAREGGVLG